MYTYSHTPTHLRQPLVVHDDDSVHTHSEMRTCAVVHAHMCTPPPTHTQDLSHLCQPLVVHDNDSVHTHKICHTCASHWWYTMIPSQ